MRIALHSLVVLALLGCGSAEDAKAPVSPQPTIAYSQPDSLEVVAIVTSAEDIPQYDGQIITIRGLMTNTKLPTVLGVDVREGDPDHRGQFVQATGQLRKSIVSEEQVLSMRERMIAHRGAGVFYHLYDFETKYAAIPVLWEK
jgi:hypothetical protein